MERIRSGKERCGVAILAQAEHGDVEYRQPCGVERQQAVELVGISDAGACGPQLCRDAVDLHIGDACGAHEGFVHHPCVRVVAVEWYDAFVAEPQVNAAPVLPACGEHGVRVARRTSPRQRDMDDIRIASICGDHLVDLDGGHLRDVFGVRRDEQAGHE